MSVKKSSILIFPFLFWSYYGLAQNVPEKLVKDDVLASWLQIPDSLANKSLHEFVLLELSLDENSRVKKVNVFSNKHSHFQYFLLGIEKEEWNNIFIKNKTLPKTVLLPLFLLIVDSTTNLNNIIQPSYNEIKDTYDKFISNNKIYLNNVVVIYTSTIEFRKKRRKLHPRPEYKNALQEMDELRTDEP